MDIYVIGDTQIRPGVKNPLIVVAYDIINTLPDKVVHLGDHWDFPSLSSYDRDKHSFNDKCYEADVKAGNNAMREFWAIIQKGFHRHPEWKCEFIFTEGNHENRRHKAKDTGPRGYLSLLDMVRPDYNNWDVVKAFLEPHIINGVAFVHYMANEFSARAIGSARTALSRKHHSFVVGHKQTFDYAEEQTIDGKRIMGLIMGACYYHDEEYRSSQVQNHFRGITLLRNVLDGQWEMEVRNLSTLDAKYG